MSVMIELSNIDQGLLYKKPERKSRREGGREGGLPRLVKAQAGQRALTAREFASSELTVIR